MLQVIVFLNQSEQSKICIIKELRNNKLSHRKCVMLGYLNINSIWKKFSSILYVIDNNLDIFAITETKLDSSFPESQFISPGVRKPFQLDVTSRKSEILVLLNNNIPSKYLQRFHLPEDIQAIPFEINLKQCKLLVVSIYWPPDQNLDYFLSSITGLLITILHLLKTLP